MDCACGLAEATACLNLQGANHLGTTENGGTITTNKISKDLKRALVPGMFLRLGLLCQSMNDHDCPSPPW